VTALLQDKLVYPRIKDKEGKEHAAIIDIDLAFVTRCKQSTSDSWGNTQPHNAWKELPVGIPKTRYDLCKSDDSYHESIKYAPTALDSSFQMITLNDLVKKFSTSETTWAPTYPTLGTYEKERKDNWNVSVRLPMHLHRPIGAHLAWTFRATLQ
jgi:hypothetical protein